MTHWRNCSRRWLSGLVLTGALAALAGCINDAFDPWLGPRRPREGTERYLSTRPDVSESDKYNFLQRQPIAPELLADLAQSPSRDTRAYVAMNPATPADTLVALAADPDIGVRQYTAPHPGLPRAALLRLFADPSALVRDAAVASPVWQAEELWTLYRQGHAGDAIAGNPNAPAALLMAIARSGRGSSLLGYQLARSPQITPEIEAFVLASGSGTDKLTLLNNPRLSCPTLLDLAKDPEPHIAQRARETAEERDSAGRRCRVKGRP
ncbi:MULTISPECIES: hypothetical protein [Hydrogenophaga]|uniref:Leucine rich repeat variant n=1 Tax=Hydrogenophaga intermedia TaxID=65786 RepID=A0A1L1PKK2_HYDIT|nr:MULTISPECIES: hypothetical protein [Hydrogenophaga]AOS80466.1 hypothetical protein Q5W_16555 [Hydrogenophaga sp. PBC]CDN89274.1 Leucine rich repeat variant [Hydrogenophaga intermedia]